MTSIDREAVVRRHAVVVERGEPAAPLSVGNGELCMTVDATGLQTFPDRYPVTDPAGGDPGTLLGTQAQWGWHSEPAPPGVSLDGVRRRYWTPRGEVGYVDAMPLTGSDDTALDADVRWLRANPHRLDLVRIGLVTPAVPAGLVPLRQELDLWSGVLTSDIVLDGHRLRVTTACHPEVDAVAVRIRPGGEAGHVERPDGGAAARVAVRLAFPYGSESWSNAADWGRPEDHRTDLEPTDDGAVVRRCLLGERGEQVPSYGARLTVAGAGIERSGPHELTVSSDGGALDLVVRLWPAAEGERVPAENGQVQALSVDTVLEASRGHWPDFWGRGAALDLTGSTDPRAAELERRVVLSQYLTAIQCAGSLPPQETGLTCNSWRGRFHLEMHWWHAAHFALWGRPELLERSMDWYRRVLPSARRTARLQGYDGVRWPKQVGPDGRESPSDIGPFLVWQQPHVIHLAELLRRAGSPDAVARHGELVDATARFMADLAGPTPEGYALGPPLVPAQESYAGIRDRVTNPPFELAYWSWALSVAQEWRELAGLAREPHWDAVARGMVSPLVADGRYAAIGVDPFTVRVDHPSMVYGLGMVPHTGLLDPHVVRATLLGILDDWDWQSTWGWDFPALAMTATRLGDPETAMDTLLIDVPTNVHLPNGHNRQADHLPVYLPGNGGLLAAVALMVAGWEDGPPEPGIPADGWAVRHEGFVRAPGAPGVLAAGRVAGSVIG